jgi:tetratricopeptide (TPR) repeat protein
VGRIAAGKQTRGILAAVIDAVEQARVPDVRQVAPRLLAYGRSLDYDAHWALAADVFGTIGRHVNPGLDPEITFDAQMRLGYCLRMSGDLDGAQVAYGEAGLAAASVGNRMEVLHARVGDAAIASDRGNLPAAEAILDEIIAAAGAAGFDDVHAIALHDRAYVANARGQYELGAKFAFQALQRTRSLTARDRILADLAMAFTQLGVLGAARDAFLVVVETAQEQYVRWAATINLLEIASLLPNAPLFEQYRRALVGASLPPFLRAQYHFYCALGFRTFGQSDAAGENLVSAQELAEQYGYNQLLFQVESLADEMKRGETTRPLTVRDTPVALLHVAEAVSEMRQLVGV